jgi:hypothetical protein
MRSFDLFVTGIAYLILGVLAFVPQTAVSAITGREEALILLFSIGVCSCNIAIVMSAYGRQSVPSEITGARFITGTVAFLMILFFGHQPLDSVVVRTLMGIASCLAGAVVIFFARIHLLAWSEWITWRKSVGRPV